MFRSSHQRCSLKKGVLRNFAKLTGKDLYQHLFFNKVAGLSPETLSKKKLWCFPVNFAKFLRTSFLQYTFDDCFWYWTPFDCFMYFHRTSYPGGKIFVSPNLNSSKEERLFKTCLNSLKNICGGDFCWLKTCNFIKWKLFLDGTPWVILICLN